MGTVNEVYDSVWGAVIKTCDLPENWLKSNEQECVEARMLLIKWLFKCC